MPQTRYVSPSQVKNWNGCFRKWAYSRVRPRVESAATKFGSVGHKLLEDWLTMGLVPGMATPEGRAAMAALEHLPVPGQSEYLIEEEVWHQEDGVLWHGKIDLLHRFIPRQLVTTHDHKFTSDLKWAMTEEQLLNDPQRIVYAHWAASRLNVPVVRSDWMYVQRNKPIRVKMVSVLEDRASIAHRFRILNNNQGRHISNCYGFQSPENFPRNLTHCDAYRKECEYAKECLVGVSPLERAAAKLHQAQLEERRSR